MNKIFSAEEATKISSKSSSIRSPEFRTFMSIVYEAIEREALRGGKDIVFPYFTAGFFYGEEVKEELIREGYSVYRTNDSFKIWWK